MVHHKKVNMSNENLVKASLIFGGGFLLFLLLKPKYSEMNTKKSFDDTKSQANPTAADLENAEIAAKAYTDALKAGEPPSKLTELNKELMKDFQVRCYVDKEGKLIVCNASGATLLTK